MSRNASAEEITAAYKKLSRLYHPDKHVDKKRKQQALLMFSKLKNAYEGNDTFSRLYASGTMLFTWANEYLLSAYNNCFVLQYLMILIRELFTIALEKKAYKNKGGKLFNAREHLKKSEKSTID